MKKLDWKSLSVIVVEDDAALREILVELMSTTGCQVQSAENGLMALQVMEAAPVDIVISDVRMPTMDGIEFLKKVRAKDPQKPVFFLATGFADLDEEQAIRLGARGLFHKPFNFDLIELIEQRLSAH